MRARESVRAQGAAVAAASAASIEEIAPRYRPAQLRRALASVRLPPGVAVRRWRVADFPTIQRLSTEEGWSTTTRRPEEAIVAWKRAWPALIATPVEQDDEVVGFLRAVSDGVIATYVGELIVAAHWRGRGVGHALMDVCHALYPRARIDLLSTEGALGFYERMGFGRHAGYRRTHA